MAKTARPKGLRYEEFIFWVRQPSLYYSFGFQHERWNPAPYTEQLTLWVALECVYPDRCKGRETKASFHADPQLSSDSDPRRSSSSKAPTPVGSIIVGKNKFEVGGFLPPADLWNLARAMADGTITSMSTNGYWPSPGHGYLTLISFNGPEFDPIAYIG